MLLLSPNTYPTLYTPSEEVQKYLQSITSIYDKKLMVEENRLLAMYGTFFMTLYTAYSFLSVRSTLEQLKYYEYVKDRLQDEIIEVA
jgi:hypothetical protein